MSHRTTRAAFLADLNQRRAEWEALIARIPDHQLDVPGVCGRWSVKDVVAHLSWYEEEMVNLLRTRTLAGSELWDLALDERNSAIHRKTADRATMDVLNAERAAYQDMRSLIDAVSDKELNDAGEFRDMPADWVPWQIIAGNAHGHFEQHMPDIRRWLEASGRRN
jgi:hypothetical protein